MSSPMRQIHHTPSSERYHASSDAASTIHRSMAIISLCKQSPSKDMDDREYLVIEFDVLVANCFTKFFDGIMEHIPLDVRGKNGELPLPNGLSIEVFGIIRIDLGFHVLCIIHQSWWRIRIIPSRSNICHSHLKILQSASKEWETLQTNRWR